MNEEGPIELDDEILEHQRKSDELLFSPQSQHSQHLLNPYNNNHSHQTLNRASKPQTPDHNSSDNDMDEMDNINQHHPYRTANNHPQIHSDRDDDDHSSSESQDDIAYNNVPNPHNQRDTDSDSDSNSDRGGSSASSHERTKPRSRPPSRRGSFLQEYQHHPYGPGNKFNKKRHRKQKSNVEEAAKKLRKEIQAKSMEIMEKQQEYQEYQHHQHQMQMQRERDRERENMQHQNLSLPQQNTAMNNSISMITQPRDNEHDNDLTPHPNNNVSDDELSDDYFVKMSQKFNDSIGNQTNVPPIPPHAHPITKRLSRSQPTSPKHYENEFNFGPNAMNSNNLGAGGMPNINNRPSLQTNSRSNMVHGKFSMIDFTSKRMSNSSFGQNKSYQFMNKNRSSFKRNTSNNSSQRPLKSTSIWRKNREAFLKQMDKKLEEVMNKFEAKNPTSTSIGGPISTKFNNKPLMRKRNASYHHGSNEMQQIRGNYTTAENEDDEKMSKLSQHKASHSTNFDASKYQWLTTKTTFGKLGANGNNITDNKPDKNNIDSIFSQQPSFAIRPRRSISLLTMAISNGLLTSSSSLTLDPSEILSILADIIPFCSCSGSVIITLSFSLSSSNTSFSVSSSSS